MTLPIVAMLSNSGTVPAGCPRSGRGRRLLASLLAAAFALVAVSRAAVAAEPALFDGGAPAGWRPLSLPSSTVESPDWPVAPEPPALPALPAPAPGLPAPSIAVPPGGDLLARVTQLHAEGRWGELVGVCETAARAASLPPQVAERYDLAKIHCDLARRHGEQAFRQRMAGLTEAEGRRVTREVFTRIASHHVDAPDYRKMVFRGCRALDVAIDDPLFVSLHAAQATPERRALYREQAARLLSGRTIDTAAEAETVTAWVARIAHSTLGIPPAVTLMEFAAAALGALDEYSAFLTTGQLDDLYAQIEGNFVGLGVELKSAADGLLVVHVIPGSPAARAGCRRGDHIVAIDGRSLAGMHVDAAAQLLQGPEGSIVTLAVARGGTAAQGVVVRREQVEVPSVEDVKIVDPAAGIAHVRISSFQKTTAADLERALRHLDAAGMRALVIDLRGNPGGLLSAAVDVADLFLDRGLVVATRGRSPEEDFNYTATRSGTWRMPLVVLIDGESASSSEILAGAIRDHGRGTLVGARSFGKGSIQGIFPLEVAGVGMRLTTARFFSPTGQPYARVGVQPHVEVRSAARPVSGGDVEPPAGEQAIDGWLEAALAVARRSVETMPPRAQAAR
ncbi:MAG: S41 family peptidase [Planctomycetes bacterium]|nr:S41 family peptidase [Planctomycetota bacterium]